MPSDRICFLDTETTGLDPDRHEIWEIGLIVRDVGADHGDQEYLWRIKPDLTVADPNGLRIGRYYERTDGMKHHANSVWNIAPGVWSKTGEVGDSWSHPDVLAAKLARLLDGAHIVGAVPSFDAEFLKRFLPAHGQAYTAHYHLIDVEAMAVGFLLARRHAVADGSDEDYSLGVLTSPPWDSDDLSRALGVEPDVYERHTALGDARWVRDQFDAITTAKIRGDHP